MAGFSAVGPNGTRSRDSVGRSGRAPLEAMAARFRFECGALRVYKLTEGRRCGLGIVARAEGGALVDTDNCFGLRPHLDQERRGKPIFCSNQMPVGLRIEWFFGDDLMGHVGIVIEAEEL